VNSPSSSSTRIKIWWEYTPKKERAPGVHWSRCAEIPELFMTEDGGKVRYRVNETEVGTKQEAQALLNEIFANRMKEEKETA
jgi:hypothetical protein